MGTVLQFAAFLCICWLIRGVITHPNQDDDKRLTNKPPNQNDPAGRDFYFDEQRANDDNIKTGRAIPQSAWSKEEKEQIQTVENKTGTQSNDEFSVKNFLSYMLNMVQELKKDIFGIKEMASFKNKEELVNSQNNFEDKNKQNKMEVKNDAPKHGDSPENNEFKRENQQHRSNYLTDYYQKNGIKFVDDEEEDEDLENFSDQSDDSSHQPIEEINIQEINIKNKNRNQNDDSSYKPNERITMQGINKNNKNTYNAKCVRITRKPYTYSSEVEKITTTPSSQTKVSEENVKDNKENRKNHNFKESTTKPSAAGKNNLKSSTEETENMPIASSTSKIGKCVKKNNLNSLNNLNEKKDPTEKPLKSAAIVTTKSPQNEKSDKTNSKRPNQNKTPNNLSKGTSPSSDYKNPEKSSKNKGVSDFDNKSGVHIQSTTLPPQNSKDFVYPENMGNTNKPYTSDIFSKKPAYRKQQEQNTSPKPADEKRIQNNAKSLKNVDKTNEYATVSTTNHRMSTKAHTIGTEINDNFKESKNKRSNVISSHTTITYNENGPNSKSEGQQNNLDTDNTIQSTTSENIINMDNLNKHLSDNFTDKKRTNKNDESEKLNANNQDKSDSESQGDSETEQLKEQQTNNAPESEISLKNKKTKDSKPENDIKEANDNLSSTTPSDLHASQDSKSEFRNHDIEGFGKPQELQESNEDLSKKDEMPEISPDYEYEYEDDTEDFDISDELMDMQDDQNQESEININNGKYENNDEMYPTTVLINEFQISEQTGYAIKGNSQEQYDTFLEYIYKHSHNPLFQSLKNQSNDSSYGRY
ncbi:hypothetical protein HNY73_012585 [Argiope bruennichi]|uniref:Uncharacterized protein n=1 Tax=Argiope bruennichi TaxID=94029 RepID=A0A8T0F157_ARGBR|nr:hypothetical protein HNY73_012585 [Argiope bruennichi]